MTQQTETQPMQQIKIKSGIPIPDQHREGRRGPIFEAMSQMKVDQCIDLPKDTVRTNLYLRAKKLGIKFTYRYITENGKELLRLWRTE